MDVVYGTQIAFLYIVVGAIQIRFEKKLGNALMLLIRCCTKLLTSLFWSSEKESRTVPERLNGCCLWNSNCFLIYCCGCNSDQIRENTR